jgi:hypothetical protein
MKRLDQRESRDSLIAYYRTQAHLARMGLVTRRSAEFFERQIGYLQEFGR